MSSSRFASPSTLISPGSDLLGGRRSVSNRFSRSRNRDSIDPRQLKNRMSLENINNVNTNNVDGESDGRSPMKILLSSSVSHGSTSHASHTSPIEPSSTPVQSPLPSPQSFPPSDSFAPPPAPPTTTATATMQSNKPTHTLPRKTTFAYSRAAEKLAKRATSTRFKKQKGGGDDKENMKGISKGVVTGMKGDDISTVTTSVAIGKEKGNDKDKDKGNTTPLRSKLQIPKLQKSTLIKPESKVASTKPTITPNTRTNTTASIIGSGSANLKPALGRYRASRRTASSVSKLMDLPLGASSVSDSESDPPISIPVLAAQQQHQEQQQQQHLSKMVVQQSVADEVSDLIDALNCSLEEEEEGVIAAVVEEVREEVSDINKAAVEKEGSLVEKNEAEDASIVVVDSNNDNIDTPRNTSSSRFRVTSTSGSHLPRSRSLPVRLSLSLTVEKKEEMAKEEMSMKKEEEEEEEEEDEAIDGVTVDDDGDVVVEVSEVNDVVSSSKTEDDGAAPDDNDDVDDVDQFRRRIREEATKAVAAMKGNDNEQESELPTRGQRRIRRSVSASASASAPQSSLESVGNASASASCDTSRSDTALGDRGGRIGELESQLSRAVRLAKRYRSEHSACSFFVDVLKQENLSKQSRILVLERSLNESLSERDRYWEGKVEEVRKESGEREGEVMELCRQLKEGMESVIGRNRELEREVRRLKGGEE